MDRESRPQEKYYNYGSLKWNMLPGINSDSTVKTLHNVNPYEYWDKILFWLRNVLSFTSYIKFYCSYIVIYCCKVNLSNI